MADIILASGSPRRRELFGLITSDFEVIVSDAEETVPDGTAPADVPVLLSRIKAQAVAADHPDSIVIGADTVVIIDNKILGKPADSSDAFRMLRMLSGREHQVVTGVTIVCEAKGISKSFSQTTSVRFYPLSDKEINEYIATGEPFDKAGAYGIQGAGGMLAETICGDYFNIVGLPAARLGRELAALEKDITL